MARTILLFDTIRARPPKQPRMLGSTIGVYSFGLIFVSARTNKRYHHHHHSFCQWALDVIAVSSSEAEAGVGAHSVP